jgi:hypothetical protein
VTTGRYYTDACDVFSFAIVVWEMITRQRPVLTTVRGNISNMAILYQMANGRLQEELTAKYMYVALKCTLTTIVKQSTSGTVSVLETAKAGARKQVKLCSMVMKIVCCTESDKLHT